MAEFALWPEAARLSITFLLALCVLIQTLALVFSHYRHPHSRSMVLENLLELSVLFQIFVCTLLHGQLMLSYERGVLAPTDYVALRYVAFAISTFFAVAVAVRIKKAWPLSIVAASGLTLPVFEALGSRTFAVLYLVAMCFWLLRSLHICLLRYRIIRTGLSGLSIKHAIDSLHSGVLFGETDGFILLSNREMQRLMTVISGKVRRNGWTFYDRLSGGDVEPGCKTAEFEGQIVCLLPDASAWMFTKTELSVRGKTFIQLTATDITRRWNLTARLQKQEALLKQRSEELLHTIANIHTLSHECETQKAKMRAHDILGQRLTLLLRTIRKENNPDAGVLQALSKGLLNDLKAAAHTPSPAEALKSLQQAFGAIGVEVAVMGALPENDAKARLFVDIVRESVTNAVRHGFATRICISVQQQKNELCLRVTNNGNPPHGPIVERGGLSGMRRKLAPYGGVLHVSIAPQFVLQVILPEGKDNGENND